ncbi:tRNA uridine-5-carboxymethylaminomethyl(34) synthesis GTPase MnmE [Pseudoramibacter alactolyticus]|jgi:tRNA modification GTPase|uniref:tRNA uridine-5-carboxymethylaminomethyl(34) synthesis GTPase MnmE n=1 Tax=Pseudoramibacter alactolyticus TaxID=113287 RepID=UPI0023531658|nr:tRNA uridine-5-carboxymethylaminomethyl(34) synthesis GTPase MnmE [Pseudoramibacter alactolyticus]MBM6968482.1 tRNA uridine-5-carboxymethylaminomethyl(34) synthesis GTPase MnmE [Pseudoramibacter alactolyticus]
MHVLQDDVIAAIATPSGVGGVGIVRISGKDAIAVADRVYRNASDQQLASFETHTIHYGHCCDAQGKWIDEVLVSIMKAPRSYTAEDVVEINCHGGPVALHAVLDAVIRAGARLADPGEFTRRAFVNGRIDLTQAEAVADIIEAKTAIGLAYSVNQLSGGLSKKYQAMDAELLHLMTFIDAAIDYPEYDIETVTGDTLRRSIDGLIVSVDALLDSAQMGKIYQNGVDTVILGEPNVGKSSLLNKLIREDKALVTDIPGTTRDAVEAYINIEGIPFHIIDTAGIRETDDVVEKLGVEKSKQMMDRAELILMMTDVSRETSEDEDALIAALQDKPYIRIYNKMDLKDEVLTDLKPNEIALSIKTEIGLDALRRQMVAMVTGNQMAKAADDVIVSNLRHVNLLRQVRENLTNALNSLSIGMSVDMVAIDLEEALENLRRITGQSLGDDIIDQIFANFCLGK